MSRDYYVNKGRIEDTIVIGIRLAVITHGPNLNVTQILALRSGTYITNPRSQRRHLWKSN